MLCVIAAILPSLSMTTTSSEWVPAGAFHRNGDAPASMRFHRSCANAGDVRDAAEKSRPG
jgi:hypothetical protein